MKVAGQRELMLEIDMGMRSNKSPDAVCFCLSGALFFIAEGNTRLYSLVEKKVLFLLYTDIIRYNGASERTFQDIQELVRGIE